MSGMQGANLIWLVATLVLVISAFSLRRVRIGLVLRAALGWAAIVLLMIVVVGHRYQLMDAWSWVTETLGLEEQRVEGDTVRVPMGPDGHFWVRARINGVERNMLVDSGASITAISEATAKEAGLTMSEGLPAILETSNGTIAARRARIATVSIGSLETRDLGAVVSPNFGNMNLLGMNFLSRLHSWRVEGHVLVLEPKKHAASN